MNRRSDRQRRSALAFPSVANHSSRVEPADACFRDCIGAAWQLLTVAPMLRPRRAMCVRRRLLPVIRAKVGKRWIARLRLMLCLWKQRCCTSTPTSSCTDSRTAPAMQRSRARRRDECSSSAAAARSGAARVCAMPARAAVERSDLSTAAVVMASQTDADHRSDPARPPLRCVRTAGAHCERHRTRQVRRRPLWRSPS